MEINDLNSTNTNYCCSLCLEPTINEEQGAKMCKDCQKPICKKCFQKIFVYEQYIYI